MNLSRICLRAAVPLCLCVTFLATISFAFTRHDSPRGSYGESSSDSFFGPSVFLVSDANGPLVEITSFGRCTSQASSSDHCAFEDPANLDANTPNFIYFYVVHFLRAPSGPLTLTIPGKFVDSTFSDTVFAGIIGDDLTNIAACSTPASDSSTSANDPTSLFNCAAQFFDDVNSNVTGTQAALVIKAGLQANDTLELHVDSFVPPACFGQLSESPIDPSNCPANAFMGFAINGSALSTTPPAVVVAPTSQASPFALTKQLALNPASTTLPFSSASLPISITSITSAVPSFTINSTSKISWNGQTLTTVFSSPSGTPTVSADVPPGMLASGGTARTTVLTGASQSNPVSFVLFSKDPTIDSFSPSTIAQGAGPITITVNGTGFLKNSIVQWNALNGGVVDCNLGDNRPTQFVSSTQLTATIFADDLRTGTTTTPLISVIAEPGGSSCSGLSKIALGTASSNLAITADSIPRFLVGGIAASSLSFANQLVGSQSAAKTVTISNTVRAEQNLSIGSFSLAGANAADFAMAPGTTCIPGQVLAPGQSCNLAVIFAPVQGGSRNALLRLSNDSAHSTLSVTLTGTGVKHRRGIVTSSGFL
jgi:hypothetical protein